ncbi:MAG: hypothetical protein IKI09_03275, partial [Bacteroidales bacterium]|nr:hypothetical protein [Bacteroidales bacterium]
VYFMEDQQFGVNLTWEAPETLPLHYNLYRSDIATKSDIVIEIGADQTSYFDESEMGNYKYQLTAVYENCESDFALTPTGEDFVIIVVTGLEESADDEIVTILRIYNASGQAISNKKLEELNTGIYILQGLTEYGRWASKKIAVE